MTTNNGVIPLHVSQRAVTSPFGLLGTDENALSFALGYTFQQCVPFLQWFLKRIGIEGIHSTSLRKARIDLQRHCSGDSAYGITDIEIHLPGCFHIVIEAKVGFAVPTIDQCRKYLPRFEVTNEPIQKLVALVQSSDESFAIRYVKEDHRLSDRLVSFVWQRFLTECIRIVTSDSTVSESKGWVRSFYRFLDQEYGMKAFTTEVWILAISTNPLWTGGMSHWDIHQKYRVWWDYKEHTVRPLYLAFRVGGNLDAIWRVNQIDHGVPIIDVVPEMKHIKEDWPKKPCTIWHFGPPVTLPHPIRTGGGMYNRRVRCDLDLLLICKTVQEIEVAMGKRREEA
jgi:hypothetical protein